MYGTTFECLTSHKYCVDTIKFPVDIGLGIHPRRDGGRLLYEVALSNQESCDEVCTQGVTIDNQLHIPFRGLPNDKEVVTVFLKNIPLVNQATLCQKLTNP
ncbi:unnamed protein product [Absidia cylindrospora]